jgi:hypothetical protein
MAAHLRGMARDQELVVLVEVMMIGQMEYTDAKFYSL